MALPATLGGLEIVDPSLHAEQEYFASLRVTAPLRQLIKDQEGVYSFEALALQIQVKSDLRWDSESGNPV